MKIAGFMTGMAVGMAAAAAAVCSMYPDVPKRMKRDGKRVWRDMMRMV